MRVAVLADIHGNLRVDSPLERYRDAFVDTDEPTVVLGHTHMPFDRLADRRRFINPGSVGMPYGSQGALALTVFSRGATGS
jgi:predicted phosphodiesterase